MPYKYIGQSISFQGKPLWELVGNLKNFGVGRIVVRNRFERYPEPSYMKIVKVETLPMPENPSMDNVRKVKVWVEKTFRGRRHPKLVEVDSASYKADYRLLAKDEEEGYCKLDEKFQPKIMPRYMDFPPLLKEFIINEMKAKGEDVSQEPRCLIKYGKGRHTYYRIAEEDETPTGEFVSGLGVPVSPNLYKGLKL